ncbi:acetylglutamate kinase [Candidatus Pantoea edessiphila]|uniref:Acetylglutamate kinase n=1 Tax=Candidatus Pantoea edessiphila TaxID=2044610 RepID=A0A2P5T0E0_9GAMM|nr:acetylglutamate kinase [Candidatus Pantoea edessiphila]PPI88020.1 acetylglutamate kinase [Candidatus Pantoea edessiphila]
MNNHLVIKLGGNILKEKIELNNLFKIIANYRNIFNRFIIIVHGGGYIVDDLMNKLSLTIVKKNGLRVTPIDHIDIITGALAGTANKKFLACARQHDINAVGLSLGDGNIVKSTQINEQLGYIGEVFPGKPSLLNTLLNGGYMPIVSSIGIDNNGYLLNINADKAAAAVALTINADLLLLSDVNGIIDNKGSLITEINRNEAKKLISNKIITNGMIIKVKAALTAARVLNRPVNISSWKKSDQLISLLNGYSIGTRIVY